MDLESAKPLPRLPFEVSDHVLDHLWDDHQTLHACSLRTREWLPTTRLHLFHSITIHGQRKHREFADILDQSPAICSCVRNLVWKILSEKHPMDLLLKLNRVETLRIERWNKVRMQEAIRDLGDLSSYFPMVKTLHLGNIIFMDYALPRMICGCPKLSSLHFEHSAWTEQPSLHESPAFPAEIMAISPSAQIQIDELTVDSFTNAILVWLVEGPIVLQLRLLDVTVCDGGKKYVQRILTEAGPLLQHFSVQPYVDYTACNDLSLAHNTQLRSLDLKGIYATEHHGLAPQMFEWVPSILSCLDSVHLERVTFHLQLGSPADVSVLQWTELDHHLARLACDRSRLVVEFRVFNLAMWHSLTDQVVDNIVSRLPALRSVGTRLGVICTKTPGAGSSTYSDRESFWFP